MSRYLLLLLGLSVQQGLDRDGGGAVGWAIVECVWA